MYFMMGAGNSMRVRKYSFRGEEIFPPPCDSVMAETLFVTLACKIRIHSQNITVTFAQINEQMFWLAMKFK